jgi:iron complex outermembrane receptor protein
LGIKTSDTLKVKGENQYYNHHASRYNYSIFLEHSLNIKNLTVSGGLMLNQHSALEKGLVLYPGIDMAYRINSNAKVYGTYNKSLRLPTFTDLYYTGPMDVNNVDLKPEEANHFEAGFKYAGNGVYGNVTGFYRMGKNMIDRIKQPDGKRKPENITELDTRGLEISANLIFKELLGYETIIRKAGISYNYTEISKDAGIMESAYLLDNLRHKFSVNLTHQIWKNISAAWYLNYQDRNGNYGKYDITMKTETETPYEPFWVFDGRLFWKTRGLTVFAEVSNIFDTDYYDFGNIEQPGRWIKAGASINIGI